MTVAVEIFHLGEAVVAEILSRLQTRGDLGQVRDALSGVSLVEDLEAANIDIPARLITDLAAVEVDTDGKSFSCDGFQTVDVLCAGSNGSAMAIEVKLGETRMAPGQFGKRFCVPCEVSRHLDSRMRGSLVAVLDRRLPFAHTPKLLARLDDQRWTIHQTWWLVIRKQISESWKSADSIPTQAARVVVFEELAKLYGSEIQFNELVADVIGSDFSARWRVYV